MAKAREKGKKLKKESIDFTGVSKEKGGGRRHIPEGDYLAKVVGVKKGWKDDDRSNAPYLNWRVQINEGKYKGTTFFHITSLAPEALFNLRNLILAATGKNVAGRRLEFDPQKLIGKVIAVSVEDDEYKKKIVSRIVDTRPKEELHLEDEDEEDEDEEDEEEDEDEEDEDDEEEEEDEEEDEDLEDVDLDEL